MLDGIPAERQAIARLDAAHVRVIVTDQHSFTEYGQGSFGDTYDNSLAVWIARNFEQSEVPRRISHARRVEKGHTMKKVGVTGAAGFIGSHLCDRLLAEGSRGRRRRRPVSRHARNLELASTHALHVRADRLHAPARAARAFDGCDAIVHLAAQKIPRYGGALMTLEANVAGVNAAAQRRAVASTPTSRRVDLRRLRKRARRRSPRTTTSCSARRRRRRWAYAVSKLYDEHVCLALAEERGLRVTILRLFGSYGPRNHPSWWGGPQAAFVETLLDGGMIEIHGDGQQIRTFTYVDDTVDGSSARMRTPEARGEISTSAATARRRSSSSPSSCSDALGIAAAAAGAFVPYEPAARQVPGRPSRAIPDTTKARRSSASGAGLARGRACTHDGLAPGSGARRRRLLGA